MNDEEIKALNTQLEALAAANAELQKNFALISEDAKATKAKLEDASKALEDERQKSARREIDAKVAGVTLPAFRGCVKALYEASMLGVSKLTFDAHANVDPVAAVDALVVQINKAASSLFKEHSQSNATFTETGVTTNVDEDPSKEVVKRVAKFRLEHPKMSYADATRAVLSADPELKKKYAATMYAAPETVTP